MYIAKFVQGCCLNLVFSNFSNPPNTQIYYRRDGAFCSFIFVAAKKIPQFKYLQRRELSHAHWMTYYIEQGLPQGLFGSFLEYDDQIIHPVSGVVQFTKSIWISSFISIIIRNSVQFWLVSYRH